jgi:hypothetical protein
MSDSAPLTQFQRGILRRLTIGLVMFGIIWLAEYGRADHTQSAQNEFEDFDSSLAAFKEYASQHYPNKGLDYLAFVNHFDSQWHTSPTGNAAVLLGLLNEYEAKKHKAGDEGRNK